MSHPDGQSHDAPEETMPTLSKKQLKKMEKQSLKSQKAHELEVARNLADEGLNKKAESYDSDLYGYLPLNQSSHPGMITWTEIKTLDKNNEGEHVWIRARMYSSRRKGSLCFVILRQKASTLQGILDASKSLSKEMIRWASVVPMESVVDVHGIVKIPEIEIQSTTQKVELEITKLFCSSKALTELPFQLKDINRPITLDNEDSINVNQDTRLDNRIIDLRAFSNQAIFHIQSKCSHLFRNFLMDQGFTEIHTPKLLGGASEGGSSVFSFKYFERLAFLAQSPQLYKQMAINADMDKVFEIGPVFRAENSNTHRHLCEYTSLDLEMTFKEHYFEVVDFIDEMLKSLFTTMQTNCSEEIKIIHQYYPAEPFKMLGTTPRLLFTEGLALLKENGYTEIPEDISDYDISTEQEKFLGKLIKQKYDTDYFILYRYPSLSRAFYSMPCPDNPTFCNSYDFFVRGEEILSGAQRIHDSQLLTDAVKARGIPPETLSFYINSFNYGSYPHAGCGIGLERVVMLFLGLSNIRKVSLFPRDPKRLTP